MIKIENTLKTSVTYNGTGTQTRFDFPFDYLRKSFVYVSVNNALMNNTTDYTIDGRTVVFNTAPTSGSVIRIYRETDTARLVSWADASVLKASDMTIAQVQQLHILEEGQDWSKLNSIYLDENDSKWQGNNHPIKNVSDPVDAKDVVTKGYMETVQDGFIKANTALKDEAIKQAGIATKIATDLGLVDEAVQTAVSSAEQASNSATTASNKADVATNKADIATTKASEASASADIATTKASEASASAATATAKADAASISATNAAQSYANADAIATQLTEYLATKESLTAPAVDKTLLIEGAAADSKVVGELKSDLTDVIEKKQSKNLLDISNCELNKYLNVNGVLEDYNGRNVTDFIPVEEGLQLVVTYTVNGKQIQYDFASIVLYDINKNLVSGGVYNTTKYTIPSGVSYVRCTIIDNIITYNGQIELTEDGNPTPYEPYVEPYNKLTDKVIEKSNIATKEYVDSKKVSFSDMTENIGCSLPISEYFMTVGIAESWYSDSFVTPKGFLVSLGSGGKANYYNDRICFVNNEEYNGNNGYVWYLYDSLLNKIKSVNYTGYGFARHCRTLNLQNCSLLAIGDSTVDHDIMTAKIKSYFADNGKEITLLGTLGDNKDTGNNNEGRAGWKTSDYFTNKTYNGVVNPFFNPTTETFDFSYYMNQQGYSSVDFVVIQLGINDLYNYDDSYIESTWNNVETMINSIHTFNSNIKVIINLPTTPNSDQTKHSVFEPLYRNRVIRYCEYATAKAKELYRTSNVRVSYCHLILNPNTEIRDNVHPTNEGYEKMALEVVNQINNWQN